MPLIGFFFKPDAQENPPKVRYLVNQSNRFESRWSRVKIGLTSSFWTAGMQNAVLGVWVAHKEGIVDHDFSVCPIL